MKPEKHPAPKTETVETPKAVEAAPVVAEKKMATVRVLRVRGPEKGFRRGGMAFGKDEVKLAIGTFSPEILEKLGDKVGMITEAQAMAISKEPQLIAMESPVVIEIE
jgi:hypothetical protein